MYSHDINFTVNTPGGNVQKQNSYSDGQHAGIAPTTLTAGTKTDFPNIGIDVSALTSLVMLCSRDVTIAINDDGSPDKTINLLANKPLVWTNDGYFTNPLGTVDVTDISADLAAGDDATLLIDAIYS